MSRTRTRVIAARSLTLAAVALVTTFAASVASVAHAETDPLAKCAAGRKAAVAACQAAGRPKGCLRSATRAAIDCRRQRTGRPKMDWTAFDACAAAFGQAASKADCRRAASLRTCLLPLQRELTNCRRKAGGERALDWAALAACGARRERCENRCGRHSTVRAANCRVSCFDAESACEAALKK